VSSTAGVDPGIRELFGTYLENSPFAAKCGLELTVMEPDRAEIELAYDESNTTYADIVHGGAITTLVDVAAVAAAWSGADPEKGSRGATVALSVQYLAAAKGERLRARAQVTRRGSSVCFCSVEVLGGGDDLVATGLVTYKIS
jgi:uncharacterized protein (TIGR00369 family)